MGKFDRTCVICGKHYEYCTNCDRFLNYPAYMAMYCSQECVDLFNVLSSFEAGQTSKEDAQKVLRGIDQGKIKMLKKSFFSPDLSKFLSSSNNFSPLKDTLKSFFFKKSIWAGISWISWIFTISSNSLSSLDSKSTKSKNCFWHKE